MCEGGFGAGTGLEADFVAGTCRWNWFFILNLGFVQGMFFLAPNIRAIKQFLTRHARSSGKLCAFFPIFQT